MKKIIYPLSLILLFITCSQQSTESSDKSLVEDNDLAELITKRTYYTKQINDLSLELENINSAIDALGGTEKRQLITAFKSKKQPFEHQLEVQANIKTRQNVLIYPEFAGRLIKLKVEEGQKVKKGTLLAIIEDAGLKDQLDQIKLQLDLTKTTFERTKRLWDQKIGSEMMYLEAQTRYKAARKQVSQIKQQLAKTKIYAPISGKVEKQIPSIGDFLKIGDPIFQIINNRKLRAHIPFPEKLVSKLKSGIPITLESPTSPNIISVKIAELKPKLMADSRSIDVIADINNQSGWQAGASVKGTIIFSSREVLAVPEQSVVLRPAGQVVYVVNENKVEQRNIEIGINQNGVIEVISGLNKNEIVALDGAGYLTDQTKVNVSTP